MSGHKTVHVTEPSFHQIMKIERCEIHSVLVHLNVSGMLSERAEDASVIMCENAQALA